MILKEGNHYERGYCVASGDVTYDIVELKNGTYSVPNFKFKNIKGTMCFEDDEWEIEEEDLEDELIRLWKSDGGADTILLPLTKDNPWHRQAGKRWNDDSLQGHYVAYFEAVYDIDYDHFSEEVSWVYYNTLQFDYFNIKEKDGRKIN